MILIQETAQAHAVAMLVIAERAEVITEARTWIGTRFHHNAAVKGSGVDCARLVAAVYTDCGVISAPSIAYYGANWFDHETAERLELKVAECCVRVDRAEPGDLALFKFGNASAHAAIVTGWPHFIHADRGLQRVVEDMADEHGPMMRRLTGFWSPRRWHEAAT